MIKHISFDLWLTLIKSNPLFKKSRVDFFYQNFNPLKFTFAVVEDIISKIDRQTDSENMREGTKLPALAMYKRILFYMGYNEADVQMETLVCLRNELDDIFLSNQPSCLNNAIIPMLEELKHQGFGLNIASNTGFIEKDCISIALQKIGLWDFFDFAIFSDEINASKPDSCFFDAVQNKLSLSKSCVLHVGDNYQADFCGALNYGYNALWVEDRNYSINLIKNKLNEEYYKL